MKTMDKMTIGATRGLDLLQVMDIFEKLTDKEKIEALQNALNYMSGHFGCSIDEAVAIGMGFETSSTTLHIKWDYVG